MHEETFSSGWSREDGEEKEERRLETGKETKEERGKRRREEEKEENETVSVKEALSVRFLWRSLKMLVKGRDLESCGDLSWGDLLDEPQDLSNRESEAWADVQIVPEVTDVPVSLCCPDCEFVEPHSSSFSKKRAHYCTVTREEMRFENSQVTAPPLCG